MTSVASCVAGVFGRVSNVAVVDRYWYVRLLGLFSPFNRALLGLSSPFRRALLCLSSPFNRALLCLFSPLNGALLGLFSTFNRALLGLFSPFNGALLGHFIFSTKLSHLGASAKLRKATLSFVLSVRL